MYSIVRLAAAILAALLQICAASAAPAAQRAPVTILVSIDGFRPDYLDRGVTPVLSRLAAEGARAAMRPSFPSKTFPNHWTLVTGLRPDRHGIVANRMEDPARPDEVFTMASDDPFWWNGAEPIWLDAERAGLRTATQFWPGSNVAIGGRKSPGDSKTVGGARPSDWQQFNQAITGEQRVNGVLDLLRRPAAIRPRFLTLYFDAVDSAGHTHGPADTRTLEAVAEVDRHIGQLLRGLAEQSQPVNLVIVADHGMAATSSRRTILLGDLVRMKDIRLLESGPFVGLTPRPGKEKSVEKALLGKRPHMECWRKEAIPARFHYGTHIRIPPIFCLAETGWLILDKPPKERFAGGNHGYDNFAPDMAALFIGHGPAFRRAALAPFDNVHIYPLLRRLLGLPPKSGVDGSETALAAALSD
ncbi:alkaline phosphatase family protein [Sphingomonas sp. DG1-23]|uniref:nucleotide pyrophosphatase/phosphodiesterase family protein n=1 Tax=Sphingomonas sp. DG1-23 TaxID=3068316 RepID=UPI00273E6A27|nr:nucleotide pyrophosphatase/phosphodiesterase family protein [Sphingomonas sp. DG1-23]MDP5278852.1 alkaline phosphatase family protein [Sphingomonas sp. DG1-23]